MGDVVDVRSGKDYKHLSEGNIPVYGTGGFMLSVNQALSYDEDAIGIGRKGTIDKPYILKAPFWTVDTLFYAIPREKVDLNFAFDVFQNIDWKKKDESTGVPSLSKTAINEIDVLVPQYDEQQPLGQFFNRIDNLITLHQCKCQIDGCRFQSPLAITWEQRKVREVTDRYDNLRIPVAASLRVAGTTPYYGANGIQDYVDGYTHDGEFILVAEDGANDLKNYPVKCVKGRIWVNNHAHVLQGKYDCADNQFLAYAISQADIESLLVGGGRAKLNAETLMGIDLLLPNKAEQIRIGKYLAQLDNLITLHQRKYDKLTNVKKSMLEKMFPQNGSNVPEIRFKGFTEAWEQRKAIDIADYSKGNGYSKGDLTDAGTPIILYGRLYTKYQFAISEVDTFTVPRNGAVYSQGNEVIVPASGETADDIARASAVEKSGVLLGGDLNILRPFDFINPLFLALAISNGEPQKELAKKAQGKSVVHIHNTDIQEVTIAYPSRTEQDRIVSVFRQLDNLITLHQRELEKLKNLKKACLEKMFV